MTVRSELALELGKSALERLEPVPDLPGRLLAAAGESGAGLLTAAGELVAGIAPATDHVVDELGRSVTCRGGRSGGGAHRALDGGSHRVGDTALQC